MFDILKRKGRNGKTHRIEYSGGMRLVDAEVDIMFIVKNGNVIYINDNAEQLYSTDKDGDIKLDGRIVNFKFKDSNELIEIFVAFDQNDSYTMFTANIERDKRLNYVAQSVFQYLGENSRTNVFSPTSLYEPQYLYTFKLYKKNNTHFMINNTHSQAYLIENNLYKDTNPDEILSTFWSDEIEKPVSSDGGDITKDPSGKSKELRFETFEQAAKWAKQHSGRGITRSADGSCYIPKPSESNVNEVEMENHLVGEGGLAGGVYAPPEDNRENIQSDCLKILLDLIKDSEIVVSDRDVAQLVANVSADGVNAVTQMGGELLALSALANVIGFYLDEDKKDLAYSYYMCVKPAMQQHFKENQMEHYTTYQKCTFQAIVKEMRSLGDEIERAYQS